MAQKSWVEKKCQFCGKIFRTRLCWVNRKNYTGGKFCSILCQRKGRIKRKKNLVSLNCIICGKEFKVKKYRKDTVKFCSKICWDKGRKIFSLKKENHPLWKGGISDRPRGLIKKWRNEVLKRDNFQCVRCGENDLNLLQVHHKVAWNIDENLRYEVENGETLCIVCHSKEHSTLSNFILSKLNKKEIYGKEILYQGSN